VDDADLSLKGFDILEVETVQFKVFLESLVCIFLI
jgi:hypothetical protein